LGTLSRKAKKTAGMTYCRKIRCSPVLRNLKDTSNKL
jgi:hypothetical protein